MSVDIATENPKVWWERHSLDHDREQKHEWQALNEKSIETLAALIRDRRRTLGLTQRQLGERVGVSAQAISRAENHLEIVSICTIFDILYELGIQVCSRIVDKRQGTEGGS